MKRELSSVVRMISLLAVSAIWSADKAQGVNIGATQLKRVMDATVYIKVERLWRNQEVPTRGSGFFVSSQGYVVTNWHVVAPQIELDLHGKATEVTTTTGKIEVVVASGTKDEKTLAARIVTLDRKRDLALLLVPLASPAWLDISGERSVTVTDAIWAVGYPFGDLLALNKKNPEVTVTAGRVTAMRHDEKGDLEAVQIDAAVNPGNSGGPVLDEKGEVVGVTWAGVTTATGTALAIAPNRLRSFERDNEARIEIVPDAVYNRAEPIRVHASSLLRALSGLRGEIALRGDNIDAITQPLAGESGSYTGQVSIPPAREGVVTPPSYDLRIRFVNAGTTVFERSFTLPIRENAAPKVGSDRDPAAMMQDRRLYGDRAESTHVREVQVADDGVDKRGRNGTETGRRTALSELASNIKLRRSEDQEAVINNTNMFKVGYAANPTNYLALPPELRKLAMDYDELEFKLQALIEASRPESTAGNYYSPSPDSSRRRGSSSSESSGESYNSYSLQEIQARQQRQEARGVGFKMDAVALRGAMIGLSGRLHDARVCRCPMGTWHLIGGQTPCASCKVPSPEGS